MHHLGFRASTYLISHIRRTHVTIANGTSPSRCAGLPYNRSRFICLDLRRFALASSFRRVLLFPAMNQPAAAHSNEVYHLIRRSGRFFFTRPLLPERSRRKLKRTPEEMRQRDNTRKWPLSLAAKKLALPHHLLAIQCACSSHISNCRRDK